MKVVLVSLEPWDGVWRRNQHLAAELVRQGTVTMLWFIEPARRGHAEMMRPVAPGIVAIPTPLLLPKSLGGLAAAGRRIKQRYVSNSDLLWINDPALGVHCLDDETPAVYDVTDDWSKAGFPSRIRRRIERAETRLATRAATVVCSETLRGRWAQRHGVRAALVPNGIDAQAWRHARPRRMEGPGPHIGYIGTLHEHRLDLKLVERLARDPRTGTVHLVGPDALAPAASARLQKAGARLHGAVPAESVPSWMLGMDVLISPHVVTDFTRSLDAIKAYEYAASGRPVVATLTSGFAEGSATRVVPANQFADAVAAALKESTGVSRILDLRDPPDARASWAQRAAAFAGAFPAPASHAHEQSSTADSATKERIS